MTDSVQLLKRWLGSNADLVRVARERSVVAVGGEERFRHELTGVPYDWTRHRALATATAEALSRAQDVQEAIGEVAGRLSEAVDVARSARGHVLAAGPRLAMLERTLTGAEEEHARTSDVLRTVEDAMKALAPTLSATERALAAASGTTIDHPVLTRRRLTRPGRPS